MDLKTFGEEAEVVVTVTIHVNDEVAYTSTTYDIDSAIEGLGSADRHNVIGKEIEQQYQDLPEPIEDEEARYTR